MGLYVWMCEDEDCKLETMAVAEPEDRDIVPDEKCKCGAELCRRIFCAPHIRKGENWGKGKGNW